MVTTATSKKVTRVQEKQKDKNWFTEVYKETIEERRKMKTLYLAKTDQALRKSTQMSYCPRIGQKIIRWAIREFLKGRLQTIENNWQDGYICRDKKIKGRI